jgi:hypothetical protein
MPKQNYTIQNMGKGYMHYITLHEADIKKFVGNNKRLLCTINTIQLHCALLFRKDIGYYVMLSKATLQQIKAKLGDAVHASFTADNSTLQFEESEVLNEVLVTDDAAFNIWKGLTDGNKRSIIYWIKTIKNADKQIEKALMVAEKLKLGQTSIKAIMKK